MSLKMSNKTMKNGCFINKDTTLLTNIQVDIRESTGVAKLMSCLLIG